MISRRNFLRLIGLAPAVPVLAAATAERTFASGGIVSGFGALVGEIGPPMTLLPDGGSVMFPGSQIAEVGGESWSGRVDLQSAGEIVSALTAEEEGPMSDASNSMIARVARAICLASGLDPDRKFKSSNDGPETAPHEFAWHEFQPEARAAIAAMRDLPPGHLVLDAGLTTTELWARSIDAALKEDQ